jgi:hydroxyacylglutathione hydrolase
MLKLHALRAFSDNYIWTLSHPDGRALVVDPGDADPVFAAAEHGLRPSGLLLTHHHPDHIGGAGRILARWDIPCFRPHDERIPDLGTAVGEGERACFDDLGIEFDVLEVPGHTRSHIAFLGGGRLFCGDTLFSLGCGRMFEGSAPQMLASLDRLAALAPETEVCCGHEYTLANAAFASTIEPDNTALAQHRARAQALIQAGRPTLPSRISDERAANPFLRTDQPAVRRSVAARLGREPRDRVETFAALRAGKDVFRTA